MGSWEEDTLKEWLQIFQSVNTQRDESSGSKNPLCSEMHKLNTVNKQANPLDSL